MGICLPQQSEENKDWVAFSMIAHFLKVTYRQNEEKIRTNEL